MDAAEDADKVSVDTAELDLTNAHLSSLDGVALPRTLTVRPTLHGACSDKKSLTTC